MTNYIMTKKYRKGRIGTADCVYNDKNTKQTHRHKRIRVGSEQRIVFTKVKKSLKNEGPEDACPDENSKKNPRHHFVKIFVKNKNQLENIE